MPDARGGLAANRWALCGLVCLMTGCGGRTSSLLLERQARGPITEEQGVARRIRWTVEPATQAATQEGFEASVTYASPDYLNTLFQNKQIFGPYAGLNPFFPEQVVFYVKLVNRMGKKVRINPEQFVLLDDKGNQYQALSPDYSTALAEAKAPVGTFTRGVLEDARPGYMGVGFPVGKLIAGKPQQRFALLQMAILKSGSLYDGVTYDGLVAFWSPHEQATRVNLLLANIQTDFNANDEPKATFDMAFAFTLIRPDVKR